MVTYQGSPPVASATTSPGTRTTLPSNCTVPELADTLFTCQMGTSAPGTPIETSTASVVDPKLNAVAQRTTVVLPAGGV